MLKTGFAQEIITPPAGVGLAGYINKRPNRGFYDDLYVKVLAMELDGKRFGLVCFDLCNVAPRLWTLLEKGITEKMGKELYESLIISATHTHTGPEFRGETLNEITLYALNATADAAVRAVEKAFLNLHESALEAGSVYNNPFGFVRRYFMKSGAIVTNPGWGNPDIDKPESDFDRTISILAVKQEGRLAGLVCNIANHGDTVGGDIVSADWFGFLTREIQHALGCGLPVLIVDDASGDINHFDFRQKISQTSLKEAARIGKGYASIILDAMKDLKKVEADSVTIRNGKMTLPHYRLSEKEIAEAKHILETVPDIPKEGDFESQDLANKVPAALRFFAKRALDGYEKSTPSHECRLTSIVVGKSLAFVSLPGEPFNGISRAIREKSPFEHTFIISLAQSVSGYVPLRECFARGGYEVQPGTNTASPDAADIMAEEALKVLLQK
ncbi:MAG: hypothetical protein J6A21_09080 [Lentisphaeria bacterium]|nr:hypothetical protein [Lentisphaeria bacterium]